MKLRSINSNYNQTKPILLPQISQKIGYFSPARINLQPDSFIKTTHNSSNVSFSGLSNLLDFGYKSKLLAGLRAKFPHMRYRIEDLDCIVGRHELRNVLENAKPENFSVGGETLENVKKGIFTINLHSHTNDSDGKMSIEELLKKTADYSNRINKPVYIGVTNHDTLNGLVRALKLIADDKEKYKNVRLVLGIEFNVKHEDPSMLSKPLQLEMIGYCLNPFNKKLQGLLNGIKSKNTQYASEIIAKVNHQYKMNLSFDKLKDYDSSLINGGSPSFLWKLREILIQKITADKKDPVHLERILAPNIVQYGDYRLTPATPDMATVIKVIKDASGMAGIAHPVRNRVGRKINLPTRKEREQIYFDVLNKFLKTFKKLGGEVLEADYQYKPSNLRHPYKILKREFIQQECKTLRLLSSSGLDSHGNDIFS